MSSRQADLIKIFEIQALAKKTSLRSSSVERSFLLLSFGPRQANLVLIAYASSEGSGDPAHPRSLARTFAARSDKQWIKRNLQTENQIPGPSEWLGMRSWNLSWRNARRHKFAWRGPFHKTSLVITQIEILWANADVTFSQANVLYISIGINTCQKVKTNSPT